MDIHVAIDTKLHNFYEHYLKSVEIEKRDVIIIGRKYLQRVNDHNTSIMNIL
jgi:hypothetical protein